jgi:hypothetical protein
MYMPFGRDSGIGGRVDLGSEEERNEKNDFLGG